MNINTIPSLDFEAGFELHSMDDALTSRGAIIRAVIQGVVIGLA